MRIKGNFLGQYKNKELKTVIQFQIFYIDVQDNFSVLYNVKAKKGIVKKTVKKNIIIFLLEIKYFITHFTNFFY